MCVCAVCAVCKLFVYVGCLFMYVSLNLLHLIAYPRAALTEYDSCYHPPRFETHEATIRGRAVGAEQSHNNGVCVILGPSVWRPMPTGSCWAVKSTRRYWRVALSPDPLPTMLSACPMRQPCALHHHPLVPAMSACNLQYSF